MKKVKHKLVHAFIPHEHNDFRPHAIRHKWLSIYSIGLILSQFAFGLVYYTGPATATDVQIERNVIELTNQTRAGSGLGALSENQLLEKAAYAKLTDMFQKGYWDHVSPDGTEAWHFIDSQGYDYKCAGENLAKGFSDGNTAFNAWMGSPTHKANILDAKHKEIGIAVGTGELNGQQTTIIVQLFGAQRVLAKAPAPAALSPAPVPVTVPAPVAPPVAEVKPVETPVTVPPVMKQTDSVQKETTPVDNAVQKKVTLGEKLSIPIFKIKNATMPQKAPYLALWGIIIFLVAFDYAMMRKLGLHKHKTHRFHFGGALALSVIMLFVLAMGVASIA